MSWVDGSVVRKFEECDVEPQVTSGSCEALQILLYFAEGTRPYTCSVGGSAFNGRACKVVRRHRWRTATLNDMLDTCL